MSERVARIAGAFFTKPSKLYIRRESMPFIIKRSFITALIMIALGCGLSGVSTATSYVCKLIVNLL